MKDEDLIIFYHHYFGYVAVPAETATPEDLQRRKDNGWSANTYVPAGGQPNLATRMTIGHLADKAETLEEAVKLLGDHHPKCECSCMDYRGLADEALGIHKLGHPGPMSQRISKLMKALEVKDTEIAALKEGITYIAKDEAALETDCAHDQCDKYVMKAKELMGWTK